MQEAHYIREVALAYQGPRRRVDAIATPAAVWRYFLPQIRHATRETFYGLALDGRHRPVGHYAVSTGTLTQSLVHPRETFAPALHLCAAAIIVAHNHPSGDVEPSAEDRAVTKRLAECGKVLGVRLIDSLVLTDTGWCSLREEGVLTD